MVIDYVKDLDTSTFAIAGFDASEKIVNAVADGTLIGTMSQDPFGMGYATIVTAARSIAGIEKSDNVYSAHHWIDAENYQTEKVQSLLYF